MPCRNDDRFDPFRVLTQIAQERQHYFITKQAIEAGYADNTHYASLAVHREYAREGVAICPSMENYEKKIVPQRHTDAQGVTA